MNRIGFVQNCEPCQAAAKAPAKSNLHSWPKSTEPWQRIHIDYAGPFYGKMFLIVVDSFSKYQEVFEMTTSSATAFLRHIIRCQMGKQKDLTTLDLLKPPPFRPLIRDLAMEEKFNKRFGTKSVNLELMIRPGVIKGCSGVIFEVKFMDGSKSRFHANQLRNRQNSNNGDEALAILNDAFALPLPPAQTNEVPRAAPAADQQEGNGLEDQGIVRSPLIADRTQRRNPPRQRRAPIRYSPS
ncbi:hypothetical protein niasHT_020896 [Heterodera trifolii]|uniref:Integrase catalytic domain-containing protein n=1 Tax=Heterodera trifolii TaxID=157864 RepID=A0ABD2KS14_9BILA